MRKYIEVLREQEVPRFDELHDTFDWSTIIAAAIHSIFSQKYPHTKLYSHAEKRYFIATTNPRDFEPDVSQPDEPEFFLSIGGLYRAQYKNHYYLALKIMEADSGSYRGVIKRLLADVVPIIAKHYNALPAYIASDDVSNGAWEAMAHSLSWPYWEIR